MKTFSRLAVWTLVGLAVFGVLVFLPAGTLHYWQGWLFLMAFVSSTGIPSIYLLCTDPAALERRMRAGPAAEARFAQKVVSSAAFSLLAALIVLSVVDHRFDWSSVPAAASLSGDLLVVLGLGIAMLVVIQNSYAASNVNVEEHQKVASTGLYGLVRHPMYYGNIVMIVGIPLALGSYWALVIVIPFLIVLVFRILDEEAMLEAQLDGYREYAQHVRYRLIPYVW